MTDSERLTLRLIRQGVEALYKWHERECKEKANLAHASPDYCEAKVLKAKAITHSQSLSHVQYILDIIDERSKENDTQ